MAVLPSAVLTVRSIRAMKIHVDRYHDEAMGHRDRIKLMNRLSQAVQMLHAEEDTLLNQVKHLQEGRLLERGEPSLQVLMQDGGNHAILTN